MIDKIDKRAKNGGPRAGAGMKAGTVLPKTLEKQIARKAYADFVIERLRPIFESQYSLVKGTAYLYRIEEHANGAKEHVLVTKPDEIGDVIAQMDSWEGQVVNDQYYYITVKAPENGAIKDMLDRALDKAAQPVVGENGGPIEYTIVKFADENTTA